jgi:hypothetical protein
LPRRLRAGIPPMTAAFLLTGVWLCFAWGRRYGDKTKAQKRLDESKRRVPLNLMRQMTATTWRKWMAALLPWQKRFRSYTESNGVLLARAEPDVTLKDGETVTLCYEGKEEAR